MHCLIWIQAHSHGGPFGSSAPQILLCPEKFVLVCLLLVYNIFALWAPALGGVFVPLCYSVTCQVIEQERFKPSKEAASLVCNEKEFHFLCGWHRKWGRCLAILTQFTWPWAPTHWMEFLTQVLIVNYAIIWVFWAFDWLSNVSGSKGMAWKQLIH